MRMVGVFPLDQGNVLQYGGPSILKAGQELRFSWRRPNVDADLASSLTLGQVHIEIRGTGGCVAGIVGAATAGVSYYGHFARFSGLVSCSSRTSCHLACIPLVSLKSTSFESRQARNSVNAATVAGLR